MSSEVEFYLVAIPAVVVLGLSKGGFTGLSSLAMPMMSLVTSPVRAAAIVLPLLIVQDWVSVWAFRRDFSTRNLVILIPASMLGLAAGWLLAARVSEEWVRLAVGVISIVFVAYMLIRDRLGVAAAARAGVPGGVLWGSVAGFTSFVSHAGGPPFQVYVMPQDLKPRVFAGTATMFFAAVNLLKVPPYILLGQFSGDNVRVALDAPAGRPHLDLRRRLAGQAGRRAKILRDHSPPHLRDRGEAELRRPRSAPVRRRGAPSVGRASGVSLRAPSGMMPPTGRQRRRSPVPGRWGEASCLRRRTNAISTGSPRTSNR